MKSIFTYPSNASTLYIDPSYLGDDTEGFQKRIKDLQDGTYKTHLNPTARHDVDRIIKGIGLYNNNTTFEETSGNNTIYKFWENSMVDFRLRAKAKPLIKDITTDNHLFTDTGTDYNFAKLKVEFQAAHGFSSGDRVIIYGAITDSIYDLLDDEVYVQVIDSTNVYLTNVATPATNPPVKGNFTFTDLRGTRYDNRQWGGSLEGRVIRYDPTSGANGTLLRFSTTAPANFDDNSIIKMYSSFTAGQSGTANSTSTTFYVSRLGGSLFSYELFTDSNKTTRATITETYHAQRGKQYTSAGTIDLTGQTYADFGITSDEETALKADGNGWCRINATVTSGTFTGKNDSDETIPTSFTHTSEFYWEAGTTFSIFNNRSSSKIVQDFILADAGSGVDVTVTISFIQPGRSHGGWAYSVTNDTTDDDASFQGYSDSSVQYEINKARVLIPGNTPFTYKDTNNASQPGATYEAGYWLAGSTSMTSYVSGEGAPHLSTINVDSNGYLTGFTYPSGNSANRGVFLTPDSRLFNIQDQQSTYVAPTVSTAGLEDVFDTNDEWDTQSDNLLKTFPNTVTPQEVTFRITSPNATTSSQNGTKFSRSSGYIKYSLDVTYPPMTSAQYEEYNGFINLLNGQKHPFFFDLKQNTISLIGVRNDVAPNPLRYKTAGTAGNNIILAEGFQSNLSNAIAQGELLIMGDLKHGDIKTAGSSTDANIYGEAKFRIATPLHTNKLVGDTIFSDPEHIIVSLDTDTVEVARDTAGFYYLSLSFTADEWK